MKQCRHFLILLVILLPLSAFANPSPTVPLDSWVYPALEKLAGLGVIDSALQGNRPWSRLEVGRQLAEVNPNLWVVPAAGELLERLRGEFAAEVAEQTLPPQESVRYLHPLDTARVGLLFREGEANTFPGVNAVQFAPDYNRSGRSAAEGFNLEAGFSGAARYGFLLADWEPLLEYRQGEGGDLRLQGGGVTLSLGRVDLFAGRQELWWGQGRHGTLILSNNARPLDMIRLSTPEAKPLPWLFRYLGPFHFDLFVSRLEAERVVPEPYLSGMRLAIKPFPWFELGASRTSTFGGEGRPSVGFGDFVEVVIGSNPPAGSSDNANSIAALDARLRIAPLGGLELYGEFGGEDEANHFISKPAWLAGAYLPQLDANGRLSLRLEYANLAFSDNGPVWYRHSTYRSGYTYNGRLLGHHAGGDSRDLFAAVAWQYDADLDLTFSCDYEQRGVSGPVTERHLQPGIEARWRYRPRHEIRAGYRYDQVRNFDRVAGDDRDLHLLSAEMVFAY
ncbi:hypothetical protein JCM30471_10030 [Desulfuromonas carbonis]|uniref:capsule assembly Wzi family protein n=1 Tax=Desulfuromonas sp. DDH964 TaxID=1823759 RepID=UPI00078E570A|nr:capsule assembly Wzi family protein [Desulfuromonas sp. DDH964]AMV72486.1 hypothetical protein DBW_2144 [Desulfuromonas sp. DDH964]